MNPRSNANQRKRYVADPPKSDGGTLFNKEGGTLYTLPHVSSHGNNAEVASAYRQQPNPTTVIPGTDPHLFAIHRRRGGGGGVLQDPISSAQTENDNNISEHINTTKRPSVGDRIPTAILVILWYCLGIISIATSKILLSTHRVPPLLLTLQQLLIGMILLRTLLYYMQTNHTANGGKDSDVDNEYTLHPKGLQPVPLQVNTNTAMKSDCEVGIYKRKSSNEETIIATQNRSSSGILSALLALANPSSSAINHRIHNQLLLSSIYFTIGFLLTNVGFRTGSAAFVETVKAAEPITSAATAVFWGIERLGPKEVASLGGIIIGVALSTLGHGGSSSTPSSGNELIPSSSSPQSLLTSSCIVLLANLCFSFRGLHQKLFRQTPQGNTMVIDDMNLQFRMQQIGFLLLSIPAVLGNIHLPSRLIYEGLAFRYLLRYFLLCVVNGVAFASYNLSSTMILSRISIVHHAALNCIRRVFAIVVTSIVFGLKITFLQIVGIICSVCAFFSYIHFKSKKSLQQSRRREMMKKWDSIMLDAKRSKWAASGKTSSSLPMGNVDE